MRSAIALVALLLAVAVAACGGGSATGRPSGSPSGAVEPTSMTSPAPTVVPTSTPATSPTAAPTIAPSVAPTATPAPAGFTCNGSFSGGSTSAGSRVTAVRVGAHDGYDRFVIEFSGTLPSWSVQPHSPSFEASPSGNPVTLEGTGGVLIRIQPVDDWTSYRAANHFQPGFPYLREARLLENFEAVQQWGLGVVGTPCLRVTTLGSPTRLVVDVYGG